MTDKENFFHDVNDALQRDGKKKINADDFDYEYKDLSQTEGLEGSIVSSGAWTIPDTTITHRPTKIRKNYPAEPDHLNRPTEDKSLEHFLNDWKSGFFNFKE